MAGLYIHIPFCTKACVYCDFHFSTSLKSKAELVKCLVEEMSMYAEEWKSERFRTIYLGGGTPSLLNESELKAVLEAATRFLNIEDLQECTIEVNPDDVSVEKALVWKNAGINRVSLGVQSFFDDDLSYMGRAHTATQAERSIQILQEADLPNISIDLIYGTPGLSDTKWKENLTNAERMNIQHLSCYALTVEEGTKLHWDITRAMRKPLSEEQAAHQFEILMQWAEENNWQHYEISNLSREGYHSRHNSSYWHNEKYLGVGPSASSYNGNIRWMNIPNNQVYIKSISEGYFPREIETLSIENRFNEFVLTGLRITEGFDLNKVKDLFPEAFFQNFERNAERHINRGHLIKQKDTYKLTRTGKLFSDQIAASLFIDTNENTGR